MRRYVLSVVTAGAAAAAALLAAPAASLAQTPLLQYTFDEPTGQALDTGTPPPANGDLLGGATRSSNTPSGGGSAVDFVDGPYAHVLEGDADKLDGLGAITVSTWLNLREYTSGNHRLASKQAAGTFGGFNFSLNAVPNDGPVGPDNFRLGMFVGNNVSSGAADFGAAFSNADARADDEWVFLAVTYDGTQASGNTHFYLGDLDSPVTELGTAVTLPQLTIDGGTARFGVGFTDAAPAANTSVDGLQDDVRVYSSALDATALEVVRLSNVPEPASVAVMALGAVACLGRRRRRP
jgi:hypothetical protein